MEETAEQYYAMLRVDYPATIRKLVPRYDEMAQCLRQRVCQGPPLTLLDIGTGDGTLAARILDELPSSHVTVLEPSPEMLRAARQTLARYGPRVAFVEERAEAFHPMARFDAIYSNLVLHNVSTSRKQQLLDLIQGWLRPGGNFVWGDLICRADEAQQQAAVEYRRTFALDAGCATSLVAWNFEKETNQDHPLTMKDTLSLAQRSGFTAEVLWEHDTFAVFNLKRAEGDTGSMAEV